MSEFLRKLLEIFYGLFNWYFHERKLCFVFKYLIIISKKCLVNVIFTSYSNNACKYLLLCIFLRASTDSRDHCKLPEGTTLRTYPYISFLNKGVSLSILGGTIPFKQLSMNSDKITLYLDCITLKLKAQLYISMHTSLSQLF